MNLSFQVYKIFKKTATRFIQDRCGVEARSLSYVSLLSLIPFMVVIILVLKNFRFYPLLQAKMFSVISYYILPEKANNIVAYVETILENTRSIGWVGIILTIGMAFILIIELSKTINHIWKIRETYSFVYNFLKFLFIILCAFVLIITTFYLQNYVSMQKLISAFPLISLANYKISWLVSLILHWILLSVIYSFIPHGKMKVLYSFIAGVVSGSLWYLVRWGLNMYVKIIPQINVLYGSLVFVPIFLLWLYFSWVIVLFGLELNYTFHFDRK